MAKKYPRNNYTPKNKKQIKSGSNPSYEKYNISWRLSKVDREGKWKCSLKSMQQKKIMEILRKMKHMDSMTWHELNNGSHSIALDKLSKDARDRLREINKDDIDSLFSIRLSGKERLWGYRVVSVFNILWWDPNHEVCPSVKKRT